MPRVSVLMSVRNGERWVGEAVESILGQTLGDLELIVVDDGSEDATGAILDRQNDPRLRVVHQPPSGLTVSLNRAWRLSGAALLARMDADDVARPDRLARQVAFLDAHPDVGLLGTGCRETSVTGEVVGVIVPPEDDASIRRVLIRKNPFVHSSVMLRRAALEAAGGYDESLPVAQDYDLWLRLSRLTRMANLPEPLVTRRLTPGRVSSVRDTDRLRAEVAMKLRALRSGGYPLWCAVFLLKPVIALALPAGLRRVVRGALSTG